MHIFNVLEKRCQPPREVASGDQRTVKAFWFNTSKAFHSRSTAELDGGEGTGRAVGVCEQVGDGDADGHDSHRVGVGLVKHGAQALDGLSSGQRGLHSIHRLQRGSRERERRAKRKKCLWKQVMQTEMQVTLLNVNKLCISKVKTK